MDGGGLEKLRTICINCFKWFSSGDTYHIGIIRVIPGSLRVAITGCSVLLGLGHRKGT